jgi:hypothetical protein
MQRSANRHPVDELGDIRSQIKALKAREEELRRAVIESGDMIGDDYEAGLKHSVQQRVDLPALKVALGERLRPFLREQVCDQLRVKPKREESP